MQAKGKRQEKGEKVQEEIVFEIRKFYPMARPGASPAFPFSHGSKNKLALNARGY
jgi:hypothetical protein